MAAGAQAIVTRDVADFGHAVVAAAPAFGCSRREHSSTSTSIPPGIPAAAVGDLAARCEATDAHDRRDPGSPGPASDDGQGPWNGSAI
jgi:hypothetical protein